MIRNLKEASAIVHLIRASIGASSSKPCPGSAADGSLGAGLGLLAALRVAVTKRDGDGNVSGVQASLGGLEEPS